MRNILFLHRKKVLMNWKVLSNVLSVNFGSHVLLQKWHVLHVWPTHRVFTMRSGTPCVLSKCSKCFPFHLKVIVKDIYSRNNSLCMNNLQFVLSVRVSILKISRSLYIFCVYKGITLKKLQIQKNWWNWRLLQVSFSFREKSEAEYNFLSENLR